MLEPQRESALIEIDFIASEYGMKFITTESNYIMHEYEHTAWDATEWLKDTTQQCPKNVTAWALASELTNIEAATYIVEKANLFKYIVGFIRELRLMTKVNVRLAQTEEEIKTLVCTMRQTLHEMSKSKPV